LLELHYRRDGGDEVELTLLTEKGAIDEYGRAYIDNWNFIEVSEVWLEQPSIVRIIGPPPPLPQQAPQQQKEEREEEMGKVGDMVRNESQQ
jgi:hypothetical protein